MRLTFLFSLLLSCLLFISFVPQQVIEKLSMKVITRSMKNGQMVAGESEIYFTNNSGGQMLTRILKPVKSFMMINAKGELKIYNPEKNTVLIQPNSGVSSHASFLYFILNGSIADMGLKASGYTIADTKFKDGMVITTWYPPSVLTGLMGQAVLVHENYKPIYMAYFNSKGEPALKVFYSNYAKFQDVSFPMTVTEFRYTSPQDSTIEKQNYSEVKINDEVNDDYLNFKIPDDAKILQ
jgi:hypothetical protein